MDSNQRVKNERSGKQKQQQSFDLERLKWIDPCSDAKFTRIEPELSRGDSSEAVLQNIMRLTDQVFDHLSVFEQYPEATSRGAKADPEKKMDLPALRARLVNAERELWKVYGALRERRKSYVDQQLEALGIGEHTEGLKVHLGSGGHLIENWLNVDAGGADLSLNVNWGLPLPDRCAAFVYSAHLLEHLRSTDQAPVFVREIHRILADGGTVRFVVPDVRRLLVAYAKRDRKYFESREEFYPLSEGFKNNGAATLDYILLFCGAGPQLLNLNHKFGYDSTTLCSLLMSAGFRRAKECRFQGSVHPELRVDDRGYNARAKNCENQHFSLFVEATK